MPLLSTELAYLAGYFDGEGCIRLDNTAIHSLHIGIVSSDWRSLDRFVEAFGGKLTGNAKKKSHHRDLFRWSLCNSEAQKALIQLIPFLEGKRLQAELALFPHYATVDFGRGYKLTETELKVRQFIYKLVKAEKWEHNGQSYSRA